MWPDDLEDEAIRHRHPREQPGTPSVQNYCCYGLFQIYYNVHKGWLATIGITSAAQLYDPRTNAYAALRAVPAQRTAAGPGALTATLHHGDSGSRSESAASTLATASARSSMDRASDYGSEG